MALPLHFHAGEPWRPVEKVFDHLVEHLPDTYIVIDQTFTGTEVSFASGPDDYVEYGAIVLGPGIAVQVQACDFGDLLSFEKLGASKARVTYLWEGGKRLTQEVRAGGSDYKALQLGDIVQWIARAEQHDSQVRAFFSKLKVAEAMVLAHATSGWDEAVAPYLGYEHLHTKQSLVEWVQQLADRVIFSDCQWTEEKARTLVETLGGALDKGAWDSSWSRLEETRELHSRRAEVPSEQQLIKLISERYPFPLAFSFRRFETEAGYPEKLRCAENMLAYLGSLGVALVRDAGIDLSSDEGLGKHLKGRWAGGIAAGDWVRITRETARAIGTAETASSMPDFPHVYWQRGRGKRRSHIGEILDELPGIRNDFAHFRYPTSNGEYEAAAATLREKLMTAYEGLRFLEGYPLWYVSDCAKQRGSPLLSVTYKPCVGDNAQFSTRKAEVDTCLYRDSVYLKTPERFVDLTPWIVMRTCTKCGSDAMFFVEEVDARRESTRYKSFNRGHVEVTHDYWDLLSNDLGI